MAFNIYLTGIYSFQAQEVLLGVGAVLHCPQNMWTNMIIVTSMIFLCPQMDHWDMNTYIFTYIHICMDFSETLLS